MTTLGELTQGWEPELAENDTLIRQAVLAHAAWIEKVAEPAERPVVRTDRWCGHYLGDKGRFVNQVILLQPLVEARAEQVLAEMAALLPEGVPYFLMSPWPSPDLAPHGLELVGHPPLMIRPAGPPPAAALDPRLEVIEVTTTEELVQCEEVLVRGFPIPELDPLVPGSIFHPDLLGGDLRLWAGCLEGRVVSTAAAIVAAGMVLVEFVATVAEARGRGFGKAVTMAATAADPTLPAVLIASDDGRPVYERLGYLPVQRWTAWTRPGR